MVGGERKIIGNIQGLLSNPPSDWPWTLPNFYALETKSEPGPGIVGYSAHKDGSGEARIENISDRTRVSLIGFWRGVYALMESKTFLKRADAERCADRWFREMPIRFRVRDGMVAWTDESVRITGDWPVEWEFRRVRDLGVLCAFLHEELLKCDRAEEARALKASLHRVMPGTEMIAMFRAALSNTKEKWGELLSARALVALEAAMKQIDSWTR